MSSEKIDEIFAKYQNSFSAKVYNQENDDHDLLMDVFKITPELKRQNRQYWGRELGMCWQLVVTELCREKCEDFAPALRFGADEPNDLCIGKDAIDTKYRIGSGDSGTLKKFKQYGKLLKDNGYNPIFLIVREDNLPAAITACHVGEWQVLTGAQSFDYLREKTGVDIRDYLEKNKHKFDIDRTR
ncbi:MAG: hypothetical protein AB7D47_09815 [Desulfovibrio sp.]